MALAQVRVTLCATDLSLVGALGRLSKCPGVPERVAAQGAGTGSLGRSDIFVLSALPEVFER